MIEKFGSLRAEIPDGVSRGSHKKISCECDCGRSTNVVIRYLTLRKTVSCGRCSEISTEEMKVRRFGSLRMKEPKPTIAGSGKKEQWICDCGREIFSIINSVTRGHTTSCGRCNELSIEQLTNRKFGSLKMRDPEVMKSGSHKKVWWVCDCDREKLIDFHIVVNGLSRSCGLCRIISSSELSERKFGKLLITNPEDLYPSSTKRVGWTCDCGTETFPMANKVLSGHTKSCGKCWVVIRDSYKSNLHIIRSLKTPIQPGQIPPNLPVALETIVNTGIPFKALCKICRREYWPRWDDIRLGKSLTCGCSTNRISSGQIEISEFINKLGIKTEFEYKVEKLLYDIHVVGHNLLIEFCGLRWHSGRNSKQRDQNKYRNAIKNNYSYLMIFEDEWTGARNKVENIIKDKLKIGKPVNIEPSQCEIREISTEEADSFYDKHHHVGACKSTYNYGAFHSGRLVASVSFERPIYQPGREWDLVRMVSDPSCHVHGIWLELIQKFVQDHRPESIVSCSDNRFSDGKIYEALGFGFDGEMDPDYFWCTGKNRHHKPGFRKRVDGKDQVETETELDESRGHYQIWDLGRKRWVLRL